jgi:hypothetical protein
MRSSISQDPCTLSSFERWSSQSVPKNLRGWGADEEVFAPKQIINAPS